MQVRHLSGSFLITLRAIINTNYEGILICMFLLANTRIDFSLYQRIMADNLVSPEGISTSAADLLCKLLEENPAK
jgi:hypothetical protein